MPKLNQEFILYNLKDVREQIDKIIKLAEGGELDEIAFEADIAHAYHHLNFAWNIRHASPKRASQCIPEDFKEWSKYPADIEL